jgi:hypothetical protein
MTEFTLSRTLARCNLAGVYRFCCATVLSDFVPGFADGRKLVEFRTALSSQLLQLRVALDELLCSATREAYTHAPIVFLAFYAHNRSHPILRMTHLLAQQWVGIFASFERRSAKRR